jgi:ABC-type glycerol-3-phosphate transport system permease component
MATIRTERRVRTTVAALLAVPFLYPFVILIFTSVREPDDFNANPGGMPSTFTLSNIASAWQEANLASSLRATLITCIIACLVCAVAGLAGGYWFRIHQGRLAKGLGWVLIGAFAIPAIAWLLPVFVILAQRDLTDNLVVLGVINGVSALPFALYLILTFFRQVLTGEMLEAAALDGAGPLRTFVRIAVPLSTPALASVLALVFVWTFGDLLFAATLLQDPSVQTVTLATAGLSTRQDVNIQGQAAASLVALLPMVAVFLFAQKALTRGFASGGGK